MGIDRTTLWRWHAAGLEWVREPVYPYRNLYRVADLRAMKVMMSERRRGIPKQVDHDEYDYS